MKRNITVLTSTRAEFGILLPLIRRIETSEYFNLRVVVTGSHLSPELGNTYKEIEASGIKIDRKFDILMDSDSEAAISKSMGLALISFADYFAETKPDAIVILGDRYEALAVSCAAFNARIPIVHIHGGEITEGAIDDGIRHAITKLSYLHMTSNEEYRNRVIQLGEQPDRVFNVGAMGVENVLNTQLMSRIELSKNIEFDITQCKYAVLTFHPVTLENNTAEFQVEELIKAIDRYREIKFIVTKANADSGGKIINRRMEEYSETHNNVRVYASLGLKRYLSAVKYASFVIGNSSSGIIEVPSFGIPTINIGDRQKGRLRAKSVIDCSSGENAIVNAINKALSDKFINEAEECSNPYGDGNSSIKIIEHMKECLVDKTIDLKKKFYDCN